MSFSERYAKEQSVLMLKDYLAGQVKALGNTVGEQALLEFSKSMIDETHQKRLA